MWLFKSSVGRKVVMSVTGIALILFLTFHMSMNLVAIISADAYNLICSFLGANWYALVGTLALAFLTVVHIVYAFILTIQNRKARGSDRYVVNARPKGVEWSSKNMLVLGIIVLLGLGLHLFNFWYRMMYAEISCNHELATSLSGVSGPTDGAGLIKYTFSQPIFVVLYIIWLLALWFHLNHGFWSALQTLGANNMVWMKRIRIISTIYSTFLFLGFSAVVLYFFVLSLF